MLFTPIVRPLDLGGTAALNQAVDERHVIDSESARIFVPQLGPFFKDTMSVVNVNTGKLLKEFEDYRLIHMVTEATHAANKEVDCVVYITNPTIGEVLISYQAIGGIYAEGSIALIEILERFRKSKLPPVYWAQIINLPDVFPVTPHNHTLYDLEAIDRAISALTKVLDRLHARDVPKFQTLFDNLNKNISDLLSKGENYSQTLEQGFMRIESNALYRKGQVKITDNNANPFNYLNYGSWVRLEDVLLYGALPNDSTDPITNISKSTGHVARLTNFWEQISDVEGVSYTLTASTTAINEGQSVTFNIRTTGLPDGAKLNYVISGVNAADITTPLNGTFTINATGNASVTITTVEDRLTEGVETLILALKDYPSIRRSVNVNDTSRSPSYTIRYTSDIEGNNQINILDEGKDFYIFIQTEFVNDGQIINLFYNGSTITNADFNANLPTQLTISGGRAAYKMSTKNDQLTEGNENLVTGVSLSSADAIVVSNVLTIRDTSKAPGYNIVYTVNDNNIADINTIDEGVDFWCIIQTENILNGSVLTINNSGTINDADFETRYPNTVTIQNNTAKFPLRLRNDLTTEGNEILSISLMVAGTSVYTKPITVNDSSPNPNANMKFSTNSSGTNSVTTANEGSVVYLILQTQGMPNGTVFNLVYSGTAETSDFDVARPTSVTVNNNRAVVQYAIKADMLTDGRDENMVITLQNSFNRENLGSVSLTIKDSSKASTFRLRFSANASGADSINNANEGTVVYGVLETTDVDDGTVLKVETTIGGKLATVANADVTINVATTVVVNKNLAIISVALNNDITNEGAEVLVMSISDDSSTLATASITVNDTSMAPTYSGRLLVGTPTVAPNENSPAASNVLVGNKYGILIQTTNVPDGTVLYVRRNSAVEVAPIWFLPDGAFTASRLNGSPPPASITVQNNKAWIPFQVYSGWMDNQTSALLIGVYTTASGGAPVVRIYTEIPVPVYEFYWATDANGATRITAVDEGKSAYLITKTTNVPAGVYLNAELFINNVSQANTPNVDVKGAGIFAINLSLNITALKYDFIADDLKEGNEVFRIRVWPQHDIGFEGPIWFNDASITITDTSYRADKIRAGVSNGQVNVLGNATENFDPAISATFVVPEGYNEAWTIGLASNNTNFTSNIWNRNGTTKVGYTGNTNWFAIDLRWDRADSPWQKSYHNEYLTVKDQHNISISGFDVLNAVAFVSPDDDHEGWRISRDLNQVRPYVSGRNGTTATTYTGLLSLTAMAPYVPHEGTHVDAPYPRIVMAELTDNINLYACDLFPYDLTDTSKYAVMYSPEAAHEGWSLSRIAKSGDTQSYIYAQPFTRPVNATTRSTYAGKHNFAIVQLKADGNIDKIAEMMAVKGTAKSIKLLKDHSYEVYVVGGGGAGGNLLNHTATSGGNGAGGNGSSFNIANGITISASGGGAGSRAAFKSGVNGVNGGGGSASVTLGGSINDYMTILSQQVTNGNAGLNGQGGIAIGSPERNFGRGGNGGNGLGAVTGGSGGGGGVAKVTIKMKVDVSAVIFGGKGGAVYNDPNEELQRLYNFDFGRTGSTGICYVNDLGKIAADVANITILGTQTDGTWDVSVSEINIYERAKAILQRNPTIYDSINVIVPANVAAVAPSITGYALNFAGFPAGTKINVDCYGKILGRGGDGTAYDSPQNGGTAMFNDGNAIVTLNAIGANAQILGGGGGGGGDGFNSSARSGGGGGAPYGAGTYGSTAGALLTGGTAGPRRGVQSNIVYGADGGNVGQNGGRGEKITISGSGSMSIPINTHLNGGKAGVAIKGNGFSAINVK